MPSAKRQRIAEPARETVSSLSKRASAGIKAYVRVSKSTPDASAQGKKRGLTAENNLSSSPVRVESVKAAKGGGNKNVPWTRKRTADDGNDERCNKRSRLQAAPPQASQSETSDAEEPVINIAHPNCPPRKNRESSSSLPTPPETPTKTVKKAPQPPLTKTRQILEELKSGAVKARAEEVRKKKAEAAPAAELKTTEAVATRSQALLDRIIAKQRLQASLPGAPSKEELLRKAAMGRAEGVLRVISMLAANKAPGQRVSFSLPMLVQSVRGSMRSPISAEEVVRCVELLAQELAPGYVGMVTTGSVVGVVVDQTCKKPIFNLSVERLL